MASAEFQDYEQASGVRGLWRTWERFWFTPSDPTTLGFMRLIGGFLILYIHLSYTFDLQTFFGRDAWLSLDKATEFRKTMPLASPNTRWDRGDEFLIRSPEDKAFFEKWGIYRKQSVTEGRHIFSLWYHISDPVPVAITHGVILLVMFCFAIGFCSRITSVLTWIFLIGYINRSNASVFGVDTMMNILALYLMIGPSGAAYSVDRLIERWLAARRGTPIPPHAMPAPSVSANIALRLIQINFCMIYGMSGLSKLQGGSWWGGTAAWSTMINYEFSPLGNRLYMYILRGICARRWTWELVMMASTMLPLALELTLPLLVWNRKLRWAYISGSAIFHLSIAVFMGLVCFSAMMLVLLLGFVPGWTIRELFRGSSRRLLSNQVASGEAKPSSRSSALTAASQ